MARILLIDDDEQLLQLFGITLKKAGHDTIVAPGGVQGLALLDQQQFDLVITDIIMPERDGVEVIGALIQNEVRPAIIAISGGSQRLTSTQLLEIAQVMKVDMVLPKPITPKGLIEAVETVLLNRTM
jgi:DNA-binding response OmpR family regulator